MMESPELAPHSRLLDAIGWVAAASTEIEEAQQDLPEDQQVEFHRLRYRLEMAVSDALDLVEGGDDAS